ncbi:GATA zinc finger domain-containing protein 10 [Ceratobasidium theobromae]|uniref:GATA zinc finger domain-containing protein 10 n=1 Tax=Ceratobasidium theobromae TaxID=1582974 RepID=A0A5N5QF89_9AGAM|nr:GATA zinc finger domain-containing protein 10 [Ceratobasidium theobromae]
MDLRLPPIRDLHLDDEAPVRDERLQRVLNHCQALCAFADHYASAPPPPNPPEVAQMVDRAVEVITILQEYKNATCPPPRAPKRPWEDAPEPRPAPSAPADPPSPAPQEAQMSVFDPRHDEATRIAMRDMEDIRARRPPHGQPASKVKYKKRSRATPPGHCHSCDISDTPEWRRGPDGQRTLCNACGLHYAKLVRKRDRIISALPAGGQAPPLIDIAFLRKSARLAAENSALARSAAGRRRVDKSKPQSPSPTRVQPAQPRHVPVHAPSYQPYVQSAAYQATWYPAPHSSWDRYMPPASR